MIHIRPGILVITTFICMQVINYLPKFFVKHKILQLLCKLKLQSKIVKCSFNNTSIILIDITDPEPRNVYIHGQFEEDFFKIVNNLLPHNGTFFDLGSNVGFCTFGLVPSKPNVNYHLFEANKNLIALIKESCKFYEKSSLTVNHCCVTDKLGFSQFHITNNQTGQSHIAVNNEKAVSVANETLDRYCKINDINCIDFLKIDLEGNEIAALRGASRLLNKNLINFLYVEIIPDNQARFNYTTIQLLELIETCGYNLYYCKSDDFRELNQQPVEMHFTLGVLSLSKFKSKNYPINYSTDILAISKSFDLKQF